MRLVKSLEEIKANISTIDQYLTKKTAREYSFAVELVRMGRNFIVINDTKEYKFYPSRFIGYANNNMNQHLNNDSKDGKETTPTISAILHYKNVQDEEMETAYTQYCRKLGIEKICNYKRTYWRLF